MAHVKICGIKTIADAKVAIDAGAEYIGLNFEEKSPRFVTINQAIELSAFIISKGATPVGIFTHHRALDINQMVNTCDLSTVQLHGHNARSAHLELPEHVKRIYVLEFDEDGQTVDFDQVGFQALDKNRDYLLFDSTAPGTGKQANINKKSMLTEINGFNYFIAGGLSVENVQDKIREYQPYAVDVASGVESARGVKSVTLIQQFTHLALGESHVAHA